VTGSKDLGKKRINVTLYAGLAMSLGVFSQKTNDKTFAARKAVAIF